MGPTRKQPPPPWGTAFETAFAAQLPLLDTLQTRLGYRFRQKEGLYQSLLHKSVSHHFRQKGLLQYPDLPHYERLEFLGDSVVNLSISTYLWKRFPTASEGKLSQLRSYLVSQDSLAQIARSLELSTCIWVAPAEARLMTQEKESILADVYEALMGAIYLESDFPTASAAVLRSFDFLLQDNLEYVHEDFKTLLQEYAQKKFGHTPYYIQKEEFGPDHEKLFSMAVAVDSQELALGKGYSKKKASQEAAKAALESLKKEGAPS